MKKRKLLLLLALVVVFAATPCLAQGASADEDAAEYTMGEVVVDGSNSVIENSTTVNVITAEELKAAGALTLTDAFKLVPGIHTRVAADGTSRIDIRGLRTRNVKLLLNGIPFQSVLDGQFDPDTIPVENIARIKITKGASSVLYGNGGTAGVIDIITKKGTQDFHATAGAMAAQGDLYKVQSTVAGGTDKMSIFAGASYLTRNGYPVSSSFDKTAYQDSDLRKNSDREHFNFLSNVTYSATDSTSFGGVVNIFKGEYGKAPTSAPKTDPYAKSIRYERVDDYQGFDAQLAMDHNFDGPVDTRLMLYTGMEYTLTNRYDGDDYSAQTKKNSFRSKANATTIGLNNQWGYNTDSLGRFTLGLIGESQNWRERGFTLPANNTFADVKQDKTVQNYTVALQDELTPIDDLGVSLGLSLEGQSRSEKSSNTYSYVVAGNYQLFDGTSLKASHARKVRFPTIENLYSTSSGNTDLANEVTWNYEVGIAQELPWSTTAEISVFRIDAENFIEKDGSGISQNYDEYRFQGVEFTLSSWLMENLNTTLGYTYLDSQNLSDNATDHALQYRPRHKLTASGTYNTSFGTTLFASVRYLADQYAFNKAGTAKQRMPDYTIVDLKVSQEIYEGLSCYVGADNLFDEDYEESYGFPRPGRVIYTGLDYVF